MGSRKFLLVVGSVAVVLIGMAAWILAPRSSDEITGEQAVKEFRERNEESTTTIAGRSTPEPGVYTFTAVGQESVKLGPLPAENRVLGTTITGISEDDGADCFRWTFNMFAEHTESTRYCADGEDALLLDVHTKNQRLGGLSPVVTMTCDPNRLPLHADENAELRCRLEVSGGPVAVTAEISGKATAAEPETLDVGGSDVEAVPVTIDLPVSGDVNGQWTETVWWGPNNLPVKFERTFDLQGPASFQEQTSLVLTSLVPAT